MRLGYWPVQWLFTSSTRSKMEPELCVDVYFIVFEILSHMKVQHNLAAHVQRPTFFTILNPSILSGRTERKESWRERLDRQRVVPDNS